MAHITDKQFVFLSRLVREAGFESGLAAINAYGFGLKSISDLTVAQASEIIDWLKNGARPVVNEVEYDLGTRFTSTHGAGKIITGAGENRYLVKLDNGASVILPATELVIGE